MPHVFYIVVFSIDALIISFCFVTLYRNQRVYKLRLEIVDTIFTFIDWQWRVEEYKKVDYNKMVYQFWKPIKAESFYKDTSFLKPSTKPVKSFYQLEHHQDV